MALHLVEVRCCCQPQKLLGYLPVPSAKVEVGQRVTFMISPERVRVEELVLAGGRSLPVSVTRIPAEVITLLIAEFGPVLGPDGRGYRCALKAEGVPLEQLRRIHGFVEACEA